MQVGVNKKVILAVFLALSVAAMAKPAHVLYHAGKSVSYPVRHPKKTGHVVWKFVLGVF